MLLSFNGYIREIIKDRLTLYSLIGTSWRVLFAPFSLFLVARNLSPEQQGFFFLFFSIAGMQQIIEAGFSHTIIQSISHAMEGVRFENHVLTGDSENLSRIREAMRLGFSWFLLVCIFCICVIYPSGLFIIGKDHWDSYDIWLIPWSIFIFVFSLNVLLYPVNLFFEGILKLDFIYRNRLVIRIFESVFFVIALYFGMGLYSVISFSLASLLINSIVLFFPNIKQFKEYIFKFPSKEYMKQTFKWQLKVSTVWCTGYFYWQLPAVILFSWFGPVLSGQYNMTITLINSIKNIGQVFLTTKAALIGYMRENGKFEEAYALYRKCSKSAYIIYFLGLFILLMVWFLLPDFVLWKRVLPMNQSLVLFFTQALSLVTVTQAVFARCCKDEPFFWLSMFTNFGFPVVLLIMIQLFPNTWSVILTFCIIHIIQFIWGCVRFRSLYGRGWILLDLHKNRRVSHQS